MVTNGLRAHHCVLVLSAPTTRKDQILEGTYHKAALHSPLVTIYQTDLICIRLVHHVAHNDHVRARRVDGGPFFEQVGCRPGIVADNKGPSAIPKGDHAAVISCRHLLELDPRPDFGDVIPITDDWEREGSWGHLSSHPQDAHVVDQKPDKWCRH